MNDASRSTPKWEPSVGFSNFEFHLTSEQEHRARELHGKSIVVDMLSQGAGGYLIYEEPYLKSVLKKVAGMGGLELLTEIGGIVPYREDLAGRSTIMRDRWRASGITCGPFPVPVGELHLAAPYLHLMDSLPWFRKALCANDIRQAKEDGAQAFYGYHQPVLGLPREIRHLEEAYQMGLRVLMLTYNNSDYVGCGCSERVDHGLTHYGLSVVALCNELGIVIDTSHVGKATTLDACKFSKHPVLANHTSADGVYRHDRSKDDDELRAIADTGGVVGIYAVPFFLSRRANPDVNDLLNHVDYVAKLIGSEHVGIGTDWPMTAPKAVLEQIFSKEILKSWGFREEHGIVPTKNLVGFDDSRDFGNITRGLVKLGYSDGEIEGILGGNFLRVYEAVCG
jgi:membrane dipeptidase